MAEPVTQEQCAEREISLVEKIHASESRIVAEISNLKGDIRILKIKSAGVWGTIGSVLATLIAEIVKHWSK
jgi:hypothetical protein